MDGECAQHGTYKIAVFCHYGTDNFLKNYYDSLPVDILEMLTVQRHNSAMSWNSN